jgi:hypothetical protein
MEIEHSQRRRPRPSLPGNALLAIGSLTLVLLALEILFRAAHPFGARLSFSTPDSIIGWRFVPGISYWDLKENDHAITGTINSWGWRDREWTLAKPPDTRRVAVLGDSYVEALQVEDDSTFLRIAERIIHDRHSIRTEWMNFGRSSCTQTEEWLILQHDVAQFSPDVVIVVFFPVNDIDDVSPELTIESRPFFSLADDGVLTLDTRFAHSQEYSTRKFVDPLKRNSYLASWIVDRYRLLNSSPGVRPAASPTDVPGSQPSIVGGLSLCTSTPDPRATRAYRVNKALIRNMAEFCRARAISLMLVSMQLPTYKPEEERKVLEDDPTFTSTFFDDDLQKYTDSLGIAFVGLHRSSREFYRVTGKTLQWGSADNPGHWNYDGHRFVAEQLAACIPPLPGLPRDSTKPPEARTNDAAFQPARTR